MYIENINKRDGSSVKEEKSCEVNKK